MVAALFARRAKRVFASTAALASLVSAANAEPPKNDFALWTASPQAIPTFDIDPNRAGIEMPTFASSCTISSPDANGLITVSKSIKVKIYAADGTTVVMAPTTANVVKSGKFPDPRLARFQCNGANITNYRSQFPGAEADDAIQGYGVPVGSSGYNEACAPHTFQANFALCDELPVITFGLGVAKVAGERFVLLGQAVNLQYHNNLSPDDINASAFSVTAYAMTGAQVWTRSFIGTTTDGYSYIGNLARVGDFLDSDGSDEIRLLSVGDGGFRYVFINPKTGQNIKVVTLAPPSLP